MVTNRDRWIFIAGIFLCILGFLCGELIPEEADGLNVFVFVLFFGPGYWLALKKSTDIW